MKAFATLALALLSAAAAFAQTASGSMAGAVVDSTGAVLPGATVTAINELNGQTRTSTSDEDGNFVFQALAPGAYTVRVELEGFQTLERKGNMLIASGRLALGDLALEVGEQTESVTVTARGERVATTTTSHQAILDLQQVTNLSIRGRDPVSLLKILPGVSLLANDQETFGGSYATPVPNIQGGRGQTLYVDGVNGGDGGGGGNFSGATNLDAIAEVNVQMSSYTAEHGLKGGAQVNFITKHGGSEYRGTAYTYQRHEMFNATNFFNNKDGVEKPEYRFSTIGGNLGGPVPKIRGLNPEGNKLFFFYSLDDTQLKDPQQLRRFTMPTARERAGDFSQTRTTSGDLIVVRDPVTGEPFPGNIIPPERADPRAVALLNLFPLPNTDGSGYNYLTQEDSIDHPRRQHLLRVDYRATDRDSLAVKYQTWYTKSVGWNVAGASARWGLVRQRYDFTADQGKIDYTRTFGANTVLELGTGIFYSTEDGPPEDNVALAGIQRSSYPELAGLPQFAPIHNPLNLIPRVVFGDLQNNTRDEGEVTYDGRWPIYGADTALSTALNLTHTRGAHTFKVGIMHEHERFGQARSGNFGGEFNFEYDGADPGNTGFGYANAFIGHVTEYSESMGRVGDNRRQNTLAWFVQDTWKVNSQLTLDLGLRMYKWDHPHQGGGEASVFSFERFDPEWGGNPPVLFEPTTTAGGRRALNPVTGEVVPETFIGQIVPGTGYTCGVITPSTPCEINGVVVQQDGSYAKGGRGFIDPIGVLFDPRLGVAYAINPKTVVRASGGVFHNATGGPTFDGGPAYNFTRTIRYTDMDSYLTGTGTTTPTDVSGIERTNAKQPVTYRYTVGLQREIGWNTVLDVAYVGDTTHNLGLEWNYNALPAGSRFLRENRDLTVEATAANPGALPDEFLRPIRGFGDIEISSPIGKSWYDSLQLQVTRRFTGGFELAGSYTWAKGFSTGLFQDNPLPASAAKTRSNIQEHVVVASYMVDVPAGSRLVRWDPAKWVLDNWRLSGISTFAAGGFADVTAEYSDDFDFSGGGESCGTFEDTAPYLMTGDPNLSAGDRTVDRWFDTSMFQRPSGRGDIGNNCYNAKIRLPGFHNHDISLFKDFPLKGNHRLQFRWEIYNLFNHPQWNEVDTEAQFDADGRQTNSDFGTVTSARNERRMQFSLRYSF